MEPDTIEVRNRLVSSDRKIRIRQKRRFLPLVAEPFCPGSWALEPDIRVQAPASLPSKSIIFFFFLSFRLNTQTLKDSIYTFQVVIVIKAVINDFT